MHAWRECACARARVRVCGCVRRCPRAGGLERGKAATHPAGGVPPSLAAPTRPTSLTPLSLSSFSSPAAVLYAAASELLLQPKEYAAFAAALDRIREDPRLTVRLGSPLTGYGQEARSRAARQRISHRLRVDASGLEHITVQFWARGPAGVARVTAEMHKASDAAAAVAAAGGSGGSVGSVGGDAFLHASTSSSGASGASGGDWRYDYLVADVDAPSPQRILIVAPRAAAATAAAGAVGGAAPAAGGLSF